MHKDPDPFDERHPSRIDTAADLGRNLKLLFRKEQFMSRLVNEYLRDNYFTRQNMDKSSLALNIAACRLILIIMPGLETSAVFQVQNDHLINRLYSWAEKGEEPLRSYATGLLGAAMEIQDIAVAFREQNIKMLPLLLQRLRSIQVQYKKFGNISSLTPVEDPNSNTSQEERPFSHLGRSSKHTAGITNGNSDAMEVTDENFYQENSQSTQERTVQRNMIPLHPPTLASSQMLILRYLTPMGEYQEFLPYIFEQNAMDIIFTFIDKVDPKDLCLAFEALKYLASLLCHKKYCIEFLSRNGLNKLLKLPRQSTAATGIAIAFYYLAYCEEAMERICSMQPRLVSELVSYALGLLGCNHDSGRCHATMFFGLSFQFKVMLDEFDKQDGLRQLYNVISVLPILSNPADDFNLSNDDENAERQVVRHVCVAMKKYFESHLFYKYTQINRQQNPTSTRSQAPFRALKNSPEIIDEQIMTLQELLPMKCNWNPVSEFLRHGGVTLFILIIAHSYEWNYSGRGETVRSALDVLNICCVVPRVHAVFCERIDFPEEASAAGISIVLGAAEGEIAKDAEVQKSALSLLVNCICAPIHRPSGTVGRFGSNKKKMINKNSEELIQKVWETVRANNGIIVLLQLMNTKTPITDADCIRGMACRALAGLARSETVRQIISKLPLFMNGQLQTLMRDPILQEKRAEHVQFQKYALELMERVSGKPSNIDTSLANIHKANVVAQTKIQFNEQQLHLLIHQHLTDRGLTDTANALIREAKLNLAPIQKPTISNHHSPFLYRSPMVNRSRIRSKTTEAVVPTNNMDLTLPLLPPPAPIDNPKDNLDESIPGSSMITPIKLIKKLATPCSSAQLQPALEKQATTDVFLSTTAPSTQQKTVDGNVTLNTIITEYLTNQHALCKNPMSTCPSFDLFLPHKCPDPRPNRSFGLGVNMAARYFKRQSGFNSRKLDRHFVHSQFHVARTLRIPEVDLCFTCCDFTPDTSSLMVGSHNGEVKVFNINDSTEDFNYQCSDSYINDIKCSRSGKLMLTTNAWSSPMSVLWSVENKQFINKMNFDEQEYVEFNNLGQDKVLGTKGEKATIYDISTGQKIGALVPTIFNQYSKNRATFCPMDELILSGMLSLLTSEMSLDDLMFLIIIFLDGVLWDFRSGSQIHKFDKLNNTLSGVFHPNGLEVVSNTEVWDLRTFHLLRTIPALDQCLVRFSPQDVIYAFSIEMETLEDESQGYDSSFKLLDSYDYSSISTTDVKKSIYDLAINNNGCQIALCENQGNLDAVSESVVRIYTVGRKRVPEDEVEEDDDDMRSDDDDDDIDSASEGESNGESDFSSMYSTD